MAKSNKELPKWTEAVMISVDNLILNPSNVNVMDDNEFVVLCKEIREGGFDEPCQVVPTKDGSGKFMILGGEHRYKSALSEGFKEIPCIIKQHLSDATEQDQILWMVKRNNIRGKIDEQKYAKLEKRIKDDWGVSAEDARREMLIKSETMKALKRSPVMEDNESIELSNDDDEDFSGGESAPSERSSESSGKMPRGNHSETDGENDTKKKFSDRRSLLQALKAAQEEVLLESGDTVEHGYLFFSSAGASHLIVNETRELHELVAEMVNIVKNNSEKVSDFLISAITKELPNWR